MKTKLLKSLLFAFIAAMLPQLASAYDFMADGLCYNFNDDSTSVTVTYEKTGQYGGDGYYNLNGDLVIPSSVTYNGITYSVTAIDERAFENCSSLTSVTIGNSVKSIGLCAFYGCTGLTSITIGDSVTSIGCMAFGECTGLTSVSLPNSVVTLGQGDNMNAFGGCTGLSSIIVDGGNTKFDSRDNCNAIIETETNSLITGCTNTIIPNSVTKILNHAFSLYPELTSIDIPNSVTYIGHQAFLGCTGLTSITIPDSLTSINNTAFQNCTGLKTVNWNAVSCESSSAFGGLTGITTFIFGNEVKVIPSFICHGLTGLTSVEIPNSVTSIGEWAFRNCTGLASVTIGNSVNSFGRAAFNGCTGLKSIYSKIQNPENVIYSESTNAITKIFGGVSFNYCKLYVPVDTLESYQFTYPWNQFLNIIEEDGGGGTTPVYGDVNGDGVVTAADVTAIYDILLGNRKD